MARRTLTDRQIRALVPGEKRLAVPDPELAGHYVRVTHRGAKSFCAVARGPDSKQIWATLGSCDRLTIADARALARTALVRIKAGLPAFETPLKAPETFAQVAETWLRRHVDAKGLRSAPEIRRILARYVLPTWASQPFVGIRRADVVTLLDHIEDEHGTRQADYALAVVRAIMTWFASRDDDYVSPIVRGMKRGTAARRERILGDDELRAVWLAAEDTATFGAIVRMCLLTGQRREKVAGMCWRDISDGVWHVPHDDRQKGVGGALVLPEAALAIVEAQPRFAGHGYVFAGRGAGCFNSWSQSKRRFDAKCGVSGWTIHDLRRTARSLMSRAGVRPEIAERVLGHEIPGVEGIYDRHLYINEKADALARLARLIERIVSGDDGVVRLKTAT